MRYAQARRDMTAALADVMESGAVADRERFAEKRRETEAALKEYSERQAGNIIGKVRRNLLRLCRPAALPDFAPISRSARRPGCPTRSTSRRRCARLCAEQFGEREVAARSRGGSCGSRGWPPFRARARGRNRRSSSARRLEALVGIHQVLEVDVLRARESGRAQRAESVAARPPRARRVFLRRAAVEDQPFAGPRAARSTSSRWMRIASLRATGAVGHGLRRPGHVRDQRRPSPAQR